MEHQKSSCAEQIHPFERDRQQHQSTIDIFDRLVNIDMASVSDRFDCLAVNDARGLGSTIVLPTVASDLAGAGNLLSNVSNDHQSSPGSVPIVPSRSREAGLSGDYHQSRLEGNL